MTRPRRRSPDAETDGPLTGTAHGQFIPSDVLSESTRSPCSESFQVGLIAVLAACGVLLVPSAADAHSRTSSTIAVQVHDEHSDSVRETVGASTRSGSV